MNWKQFGLHSLRSAAACAGVPDRLFKHHGRWCSENTKRWLCQGFCGKPVVSIKENWCLIYPLFENTLDPTYIQYELTCVMITCTSTIVMHFLCPLAQLPDTK